MEGYVEVTLIFEIIHAVDSVDGSEPSMKVFGGQLDGQCLGEILARYMPYCDSISYNGPSRMCSYASIKSKIQSPAFGHILSCFSKLLWKRS